MTPKQYWDNAAKDPDVLNKYICDPVFDTEDFLKLIEACAIDWNNVMDYGCGIGRLLKPLAERHPLCKFYGVDISEEMIKLAPKLPNVEYQVSTNNLDMIYSMLVFQHMPHDVKLAALDMFTEVLKPGGLLLFQFVVGDDEDELVNHQTSVLSMVEACEERGFTILTVKEGVMHPQWCFIYAGL